MEPKILAYWATTVLFSLAMTGSGVADVLLLPELAEGMAHLGYPTYFTQLIGVWKLLGVVALLTPRFPRLKEWAYAGFFFDLTGAAISHAAVGDGLMEVLTPLILGSFGLASYLLRPASLAFPTTASSSAATAGVR